jgi:hypothetical protein
MEVIKKSGLVFLERSASSHLNRDEKFSQIFLLIPQKTTLFSLKNFWRIYNHCYNAQYKKPTKNKT